MSDVEGELIQVDDGPVFWWPYCVELGCSHRVCTWRSGSYCYPHCDTHGISNPRKEEFDETTE